jgi:hypothetical protein
LLTLGEQEWLDLYSQLAKLYDNKCHTKNRANCYLIQDEFDRLMEIKNKLDNAEYYKDAIPCAAHMFGNIKKKSFQKMNAGEKFLTTLFYDN